MRFVLQTGRSYGAEKLMKKIMMLVIALFLPVINLLQHFRLNGLLFAEE
jgi:hypothetical protein